MDKQKSRTSGPFKSPTGRQWTKGSSPEKAKRKVRACSWKLIVGQAQSLSYELLVSPFRWWLYSRFYFGNSAGAGLASTFCACSVIMHQGASRMTTEYTIVYCRQQDQIATAIVVAVVVRATVMGVTLVVVVGIVTVASLSLRLPSWTPAGSSSPRRRRCRYRLVVAAD
ncbi:hypothetical protein EDB92DRAFT_1819666 [Lactarius akahatsu]|uniref:Uncharacterized protein n=1 Tax=Lactarius akahatsu TaxID=416441 RepID=A0AAD4Q9E6_9AGAM|nr:hypothetical protein EDB92DRAFT_1819666 [Lactarius akahatsu]